MTDRLDHAARRTRWAALALAAAADELHAAGEDRSVTTETFEQVVAEAQRVSGLVPLIEAASQLAGSERRTRHAM